jgi:hypothetical protein
MQFFHGHSRDLKTHSKVSGELLSFIIMKNFILKIWMINNIVFIELKLYSCFVMIIINIVCVILNWNHINNYLKYSTEITL